MKVTWDQNTRKAYLGSVDGDVAARLSIWVSGSKSIIGEPKVGRP